MINRRSDEQSGILIVGNYCHDTLILPTGTYETLGGSSSYISAAFSSLPSTRFNVIAKVGVDFLYNQRITAPPLIAKNVPTTHFVDDLTGKIRTERVKAVCAPIFATDIPKSRAKIGIACGVAMEIMPETVQRMRGVCDLVVADAQALLREIDQDGKVFLKRLVETEFCEMLDRFDFIKASEHEAKFIDISAVRKKTTMIITKGPAGCSLINEKQEVDIPTTPVEEVDSTGAGDCFLAGFTHGLLNGLSVEEAAKRGNSFGAFAVKQVGVPNFKNYV